MNYLLLIPYRSNAIQTMGTQLALTSSIRRYYYCKIQSDVTITKKENLTKRRSRVLKFAGCQEMQLKLILTTHIILFHH